MLETNTLIAPKTNNVTINHVVIVIISITFKK